MRATTRATLAAILATTIAVDAHAFVEPGAPRYPPMRLTILGRWNVLYDKPALPRTFVFEADRIEVHIEYKDGPSDYDVSYEVVREDASTLSLLVVGVQHVEIHRDPTTNELVLEVGADRARLVAVP